MLIQNQILVGKSIQVSNFVYLKIIYFILVLDPTYIKSVYFPNYITVWIWGMLLFKNRYD